MCVTFNMRYKKEIIQKKNVFQDSAAKKTQVAKKKGHFA